MDASAQHVNAWSFWTEMAPGSGFTHPLEVCLWQLCVGTQYCPASSMNEYELFLHREHQCPQHLCPCLLGELGGIQEAGWIAYFLTLKFVESPYIHKAMQLWDLLKAYICLCA